MIYSSKNRITVEMVVATNRQLCRNAWGFQTDIQSIGYDCLCPLAALLYKRDSYKAVDDAIQEVKNSDYSKGFQDAWDGKEFFSRSVEYLLGHQDGKEIVKQFIWGRTHISDGEFR